MDVTSYQSDLDKSSKTLLVPDNGRPFVAGVTGVRSPVTTSPAPLLPGLTGREVPLKRGRFNATYLEGHPQSYLAKRLASESRLSKIDAELLNRFFDTLRQTSQVLVLPHKLDGSYLHAGRMGEPIMIFDWFGAPPRDGRSIPKLTVDCHVDVAIAVARELGEVPTRLVEALWKTRMRPSVTGERMEQLFSVTASLVSADRREVNAWCQFADRFEEDNDHRVCHGDLNTSNVIELGGGDYRVVDLDNLLIGPPYTDLLFVLGSRGASWREVSRYIARVRDKIPKTGPPTKRDVLSALQMILGWLESIRRQPVNRSLVRQIQRHQRGAVALLRFGKQLKAA